MFNEEEWVIFWKSVGISICIGIGIDIALFVWTVFAGFVNIFCGCFGCSENTLSEVKEITLLYVLLIALAIGAIIGIFGAISKYNERKREEKCNRIKQNGADILNIAKEDFDEAIDKKEDMNTELEDIEYYKEDKVKEFKNIQEKIEKEQRDISEYIEKYKID